MWGYALDSWGSGEVHLSLQVHETEVKFFTIWTIIGSTRTLFHAVHLILTHKTKTSSQSQRMSNMHIPCLRGICELDPTCELWLVVLLVTTAWTPELCTRAVGWLIVVPMPRGWFEACIYNKCGISFHQSSNYVKHTIMVIRNAVFWEV
jgi:hypothetical protein